MKTGTGIGGSDIRSHDMKYMKGEEPKNLSARNNDPDSIIGDNTQGNK